MFRSTRGWHADEVVVLHAGNMGHKQGLENVVESARLAVGRKERVRFVLLGDGNQRAALEAFGEGVETLEFLRPVSEEEYPAALGAADVLLVNERPGVAHMAVPSKLTSYFRSGKPILAATAADGFTAKEVTASGAGVCVPADRPDLLLDEALRLAADGPLPHDSARQDETTATRCCRKRLRWTSTNGGCSTSLGCDEAVHDSDGGGHDVGQRHCIPSRPHVSGRRARTPRGMGRSSAEVSPKQSLIGKVHTRVTRVGFRSEGGR